MNVTKSGTSRAAALSVLAPIPPIDLFMQATGMSLDMTLGASEIGVNLSSIAFGITLLQMYIYFQRYPRDKAFQKVSVMVLATLDCLQLVFTIHFVYYYTVTEWGNVQALATELWSFKLQFLFTIVILLLVQSLYVARMWKLPGQPRAIPIVLTITTLAGYGIGSLLAVKIYQVHDFSEIPKMDWTIYLGLCSASLNDLLIASSFFVYFRRQRETIANRSMVTKLMVYIVSTGFFTSAVSMVEIGFLAAMPNNLIFITLGFLLSKFYVNSFLALLNARQYLREQHDTYSLPPLSALPSNHGTPSISQRHSVMATISGRQVNIYSSHPNSPTKATLAEPMPVFKHSDHPWESRYASSAV